MTLHASAPLRILIIDDSAVDAKLLPLLLRDRGVEACFTHASNEVSVRAALSDGTMPDLILSDVNMPGFGGDRAFALRCELAPHVRFCFLSDSIDTSPALPAADAVLRKDQIDALIAQLHAWFGERARAAG